MTEKPLVNFFKQPANSLIIVLAALVFSITAYHSHGFYHADEHYQIIEFADFKLGNNSASDLPWEFKAQIRPTIQPTIGAVFLKTFAFFQVTNPYHQAFLLRLISALFALIVISYFVKNTKGVIADKRTQIVYTLLSFFLWFTPFISVRFSSETWAGLLFLLAIAIYVNTSTSKWKPLQIGLLMGLSFLFRFQMAFAILGFGLWLLIIQHSNIKYLLQLAVSFLIVLLLGVGLDSWFYGEFVFTPWQYFYVNIIEGAASGFGTSPWYFYITHLFSAPSYFVGIPIFMALVLLLIYKPKHYLLWILIPFILGHSLVSHKEVRFLFPLIYFFPLLLIQCYLIIVNLIASRIFKQILNTSLLIIFAVISAIGLTAMGQKSAGIGRMEITKYIHDQYGQQPIHLVFCSWANPYDPYHSKPLQFYTENTIQETRIKNLCELNDSLFKTEAINLLVIRKVNKQDAKCAAMLDTNYFQLKVESMPHWIANLNEHYNGFENKNILELYEYAK